MTSSSHHHRSSSPGRKAINANNYGRYSDLDVNPSSRDYYLPPRSSGDRLAPPSATQTYVRDSRTAGHDRPSSKMLDTHEFIGRPRRSTFNEGATPPLLLAPRIIPSTSVRPTSPLSSSFKSPHESQNKVVKKTYIIGDNKTTLVDNVDLKHRSTYPPRQSSDDRGTDSNHRSRQSVDRVVHAVSHGSRGEKPYHLTGPQSSHRDSVIQTSYPDGGSGYHEREPATYSSQLRPRPRRRSVDGRDRPTSLIYDSPRYSQRDFAGGPPSSKALDRFNETVTRSNSSRQSGTKVAYEDPGWVSQNDYPDGTRTTRRADTVPSLTFDDHDYPKQMLVSPHGRTPDPYVTLHSAPVRDSRDSRSHEEWYGHDQLYGERREARNPERNDKPRYQDVSVERRGFGLRPASNERVDYRSSAESFDRRAAAAAPEVREPRYEARTEPERHERDLYRDEVRDDRHRRDREPPRATREEYDARKRDEHRGSDREDRHRDYDRDYEHKHRERPRERDSRHDTRHEQDHHDDRIPGVVPVAMAGGLGAATAAYGSHSKRREHHADSESSEDSGRERNRDRESRKSRFQDRPMESLGQEPRRPYPSHDLDVVNLPSVKTSSGPSAPPQQSTSATADADEDYLRRLQQAQETLRPSNVVRSDDRPLQDQIGRSMPSRGVETTSKRAEYSPEPDTPSQRRAAAAEQAHSSSVRQETDRPFAPAAGPAYAQQNRVGSSGSSDGVKDREEKKQVRIVEPAEEGENKPKGILKKPKEQFPEHPNPIREGVAPLKDKAQSKDIPAGAKWTKVTRSQVNAQALEEAGERFEERDGCVIILRVVTRKEIEALAEKTRQIRERRHRRRQEEYERETRRPTRRDGDEYSDASSSGDEFSERRRAPRMLEAAPPAAAQASPTGYSLPAAPSQGAANNSNIAPPPLQHQQRSMPGPPQPGAYPPPPLNVQGSDSWERERRDREWAADRERGRERDCLEEQ